jgi:DNA modification methylase
MLRLGSPQVPRHVHDNLAAGGYLIKTYTDSGMTVLDCTIGSGSTAVAAIQTNSCL